MSIHPAAIVHPDAILGEGVEIGPYAVIEGAAQIGDGCVIQSHAVIGANVVIGRENLIGYGCLIGGDPQDFAFKPEIRSSVHIGDRNRIRDHATIHRGTTEGSTTIVGNDCYLMGGVHLAHNVALGNNVVIANNALLGGYVKVADRAFIGGGAVFHQHARVGRLAMIQGLAGFSKDVPPFTIGAEINTVAGLNVVGLRRAGFSAEIRNEIKAAFRLIYLSGLNVKQALQAASERTWGAEAHSFIEFITAAKQRGICGLLRMSARSAGESGE